MTELEQKAINKLDAECDASPDNTAYRAIEEYLRSRLTGSIAVCEAILAEGKTIKGALGAMEDVARKNKVGICGVVAPDQALKIIDTYFGIKSNSQTTKILPEIPKPSVAHAPAGVEVKSIFDLL
jgi:hypothetical protein